MGSGDHNDDFEDLWKELTEPRALETTLSDLVPTKENSADARTGKAMLGQIVLGKFRIDRFLDGGAVGRIFRGTQLGLGRPVAIKVLRKQSGPRGELAQKRFIREAKFLADMQHPNVVELIDYGDTDKGDSVMVMELLEGHTLKSHLEQGPMHLPRILNIGVQLAEAVARAHQLGGVHRDLKPANVFIERDEQDQDLVKVLDFGLVKPSGKKRGGDGAITLSGYVLGTPFYMAPEQAMGDKLDARADIYSLAVMIYEMVTGVPPFRGDTVAEILSKHLETPPPPFASGNPRITGLDALEGLIQRMMAKEPDDRPASMQQVAHALDVLQQNRRARARQSALHQSLAGWDPNERTDAYDPANRPAPKDEGEADPWHERSDGGFREVSGFGSRTPVAFSDGSDLSLVKPVDDDERDISGLRVPPELAAQASLSLPSSLANSLPRTPEEPPSALEAPSAASAPVTDSEAALVPYESGGRLLPPPSVSPPPAPMDEALDGPADHRAFSRWMLLAAGAIMLALAIGLVQWAESSFDGSPPPVHTAE